MWSFAGKRVLALFDLLLFTSVLQFAMLRNKSTIQAHDPAKLLTKKGKLVVVCLGDSLMSSRYLTGSSLPTLLQHKLGAQRFAVRNFGSDGSCVLNATCEKPFKYTREYGRAKAVAPNIVIMMFGTTDAKSVWNASESLTRRDFKRDYSFLVEEYQSLKSHPTVFLCVPPPVYCRQCSSDVNKEVIHDLFPTLIPEIAHRTGAIAVNMFELLGGHQLSKPLYYFDRADPRKWKNKFPQDGKCHESLSGRRCVQHCFIHEF